MSTVVGQCETTKTCSTKDIAVSKFDYLNQIKCPSISDSLALRFEPVVLGNDALIIAEALSDEIKLNEICGYHIEADNANLQPGDSPDNCYSVSGSLHGEIILTAVPSGQALVATSEPIIPNSDEVWKAISQMCGIRNQKHKDCKREVIKNSSGCFYDLSLSLIQDKSFNLQNYKKKACLDTNPDSFAQRMAMASNIWFGNMSNVVYSNRTFVFHPTCVIKAENPVNVEEITLSSKMFFCFY